MINFAIMKPIEMIRILKHQFALAAFAASAMLLSACQGNREAAETSNQQPQIFPDYRNVTLPPNIAPINFMIADAHEVTARFLVDGQEVIDAEGRDGVVDIQLGEWQSLMRQAAGHRVEVEVSAWSDRHPEGLRYRPFAFTVATDSIDPYVAYRLIEPGYEAWRQMGIYERQLDNFEETEVVSNKTTKSACVNCHHFDRRSAQRMMFHARGANGGTIILDHGQLTKVKPEETGPHKGAVYPAWHPAGRYIAFSSNQTRQTFFGQGRQPLEVYDRESDLILFDTQTNQTLSDPRFLTAEQLETFPAWSPDGRWLYFCAAPSRQLPDERRQVHYSILRVAFDAATGQLGSEVDTIYNARTSGGSASFPRISPSGDYLLFTHAAYGTFPIWHNEADLRMIDLHTLQPIDISAWNAKDQTDSYHSWSANGRWVIFSSRRLDGRYTRLFIGYLDRQGKAHKPFLLPQRDPRANELRLKSYNIPEFVDGRIDMPAQAVELFRCPDKLIQ